MLRSLQRAEFWLTRLLVFVVPVLIWRVALDPFDLMKGSFLWIIGSTLLLVRLVRYAGGSPVRVPRLLWIPVCALMLAASATTLTSMSPWTSLFGQYQRYTGLLTFAGLSVLALVLADQGRDSARVTVRFLYAAGVVVVFYGFVQQYGKDPLEWSSSSFGRFVFSTLGNPNTASAWLSVFIPLLVACSLKVSRDRGWQAVVFAMFASFAIALLPAFYSFQGQVAVGMTLPVCLLVARAQRVALRGWCGALIIGLTTIVNAQFDYATMNLLVTLLVSAVGFGLFGSSPDHSSTDSAPAGSDNRRKVMYLSGLLGLFGGGALVALGWSRISAGLRGGFLERGDFYRAGWKVFVDNPVLGPGLETFGFTYTLFRPESHAVNLESSRTSSVHSIFLGMFSNGGVVLGFAYLILIGAVGFASIRLLKLTSGRDPLDLGLVCSWLAFQVISFVSVEHVGLYTLHFTLIGLIFGRLNNSARVASKATSGSRNKRRADMTRIWVAAGVAVVLGVLSLTQTTRPLRAAMAGYSGLQSYYSRADLKSAQDDLMRAVETAPWESLYSLQLAEVESELGNTTEAVLYAKQAASRSFYLGSLIMSPVQIVFGSGDTEGALDMMRKAVANDPYAPSLKKNLAILSVLAAERYKNAGDIATARTLLEDGLTLDPTIEAEGLDALKDAVGL